MSRRIALFFWSSSTMFLQCAASGCFFRNGTENPSNVYNPCSSSPSNPLSTICCASWDDCLPNGLCRNVASKTFFRETCTKQDWTEGGCQEICSTESDAQRSTDVEVQPCDGTADSLIWCCGRTTNCCLETGNITRYTIAARFGDPIPTAVGLSTSPGTARASSVASSIAQAPSTTLSVSSTASPAGNTGLSVGAKAGIGIGAALVAIAVVALGIFIVKAMRWRKQVRAIVPSYSGPVEEPTKEAYQYNLDGGSVQQLSGLESQVHELHTSGSISELHVVTRSTEGCGIDTNT